MATTNETDTTPFTGETFIVRGTVKRPDGAPVAGAIVKAYDKDLRKEQLLGESKTDRTGQYEIRYSPARFSRAEKKSADLIVRVYTDNAGVLAESAIVFNAREVETVDIVVADLRSEYERLAEAVLPLLVGQGISLTDLTEDETHKDLSFLSGETGEARRHLELFVLAEKLSLEAEAQSRQSSGTEKKARKVTKQRYLSAEIFYGLVRRNLPTTLKGLLAQRLELLKQALEASRRNGIIRATLSDDEIGLAVKKFRKLALNQLLQPQEDSGKPPLGALLETSTLPRAKHRAFADFYLDHVGPIDKFWEKLKCNPNFKDSAGNLQRTFQLFKVTQNYLPMLLLLKKTGTTGGLNSPRELADIDETGWKKLINKKVAGKAVGFPPDTPGKDDAEKIDNYAHALAAAVESAVPTAVFAARFKRQGIPGTEPIYEGLRNFFDSHPEFDLGSTYIEKYFADQTSLRDLPNRGEVIDQLKRIQRVFRLAPRFGEVRALLGVGIHSAQQIAFMGRDRFVEMMVKHKFPAEEKDVQIFYHRAERANLEMGLIRHRYSNQHNQPNPQVLPPLPKDVEGTFGWAALFGGPISFCECEHCRSVYGPAAYLVDLLQFIIERMDLVNEDGERTRASEVLFDPHRRRDILNIQLTCKNTNTPLPYIDLVNEILENAVAPGHHDRDWPQTTGTADELSAVPEHINNNAYDLHHLGGKFYPWNLPWNLPLEEVRLWLRHLGVERHELMKVFRPASGEPADIDIASEYLGLSPADRKIINDTFLKPNHAKPHSWEFWGLEQTHNWIPNPVEPDQPLDLDWISALSRARVFMQRSGLTYEQVQELFDLQFIDRFGNARIHIPNGEACNLDEHRIEILPQSRLDSCHRFLLLWRKLGWTMSDLDLAIVALKPKGPVENFAAADLDDALLQDLSNIQSLQREIGLPLETLLVWWSPINAYRYKAYSSQGQAEIPSLYDRLFRGKWVQDPLLVQDPLQDELFPEDPRGLADARANPDRAAAIAAAFGISIEDFNFLTGSAMVCPEGNLDPPNLSLQSLSALYRNVTLARALGLSYVSYLSLRQLLPADPFVSPAEAIAFVESVRKLRALPFSIDELSYLLRHQITAGSALEPDENATTLLLSDLFTAFDQIVTDAASEQGFNLDTVRIQQEELVKDRLATTLGLDKAIVALLLERVLAPRGAAPKALNDFVRLHGLFADYFPTPNLDGEPVQKIDGRIQFDWATSPPVQGSPVDRFSVRWRGKLLSEFSENYTFYVRADDGCKLWVHGQLVIDQLHDQTIAEHSGSIVLTAATLHDITLEYYKNQTDQDEADENENHAVVELSWSSPSIPRQIVPESHFYRYAWDEAEPPELFAVMRKAALVIKRFNMTVWEVTYLAENGEYFGGFDFNAFPLQSSDAPTPSFSIWEQVSDFLSLRERLPGGLATLRATLELAGRPELLVEELLIDLSQRAGWNLGDLRFLAGEQALGLGLRFPLDFRNGSGLARLGRCFELLDRLGVSAEQCFRWAEPALGVGDAPTRAADAARRVAKSKYDEQAWLTVAKPVQDILRIQRRQALVAYLSNYASGGYGPFQDTNELFQHFLIDVEMSPCMMTSSIKQAIGSVQLFILRCMMNHDPAGYPYPEGEWATYWEWMKNYRVWEANRKIFLYPENWIEPELRDDKSPFFKDLENELLQNEVNTDTVESAYRNYLDKLKAVARLEMCGVYHEVDDDTNILHVFGRTWSEPRVYYYRRHVDTKTWTAWERVDLDIPGDHLIPVVWNQRLYLFWPIFTEKVLEMDPPREDAEPEAKKQQKYWEIQIASSEYKKGRWSAKQISKLPTEDSVDIFWGEQVGVALDLSSYTFKGVVGTRILQILLYNESEFGRKLMKIFSFQECDGNLQSNEGVFRALNTPQGTVLKSMVFVEHEDTPLYLTYGEESDQPILRRTPGKFHLLFPHQDRQYSLLRPFFYWDDTRTFFVTIDFSGFFQGIFGDVEEVLPPVSFRTFYHPYARKFISQLNRYGIDGLLAPDGTSALSRQMISEPEDRHFESESNYFPTDLVAGDDKYPREEIDVTPEGAYSLYNWELFFHAPLLIADRLSRNQKFEEAQRWFHYIFDPTDRSDEPSPQRYWKFRKFYEDAAQPIQTLQDLLADADKVREQVDAWRKHPFNPHLIARMRTSAYQKTVVMKYIDNLIAWGDQLFRRETIEAINEATLLYVLAAQTLGPKPVKLPVQDQKPKTYEEIRDGEFDALSNPEIENLFFGNVAVPDLQVEQQGGRFVEIAGAGKQPRLKPQVITSWYFCVSPNDKLLGYWDTVADRLFKIRHCMNIEGIVRQLPLFEPPIEPGLLVRAAAAGVDISSVLNHIDVALPHYRFNVMLPKAIELCNEIRSLGAALLSALEKKDSEELALLRSSQEISLLEKIREAKNKQIEEAQNIYEGLNRTKVVTETRRNYYRDIVRISDKERLHMSKLNQAYFYNQIALGIHAGVAAAWLIPNVEFGVSGWASSPVATTSAGGFTFGNLLNAAVKGAELLAADLSHDANMASINASYARRWDDWKLQEEVANKELDQIDKQMAAAEIRHAIAEKELENHDVQIENAKDVDDYLRSKFTDRELYDWMVSQVAGIYFQSYQFAYDVAKRAERAYSHELGLSESNFIQFGYWDSLKKGLLAAEKLYQDLKRMEMSYLEQNKREYEITKHVSLLQLDPEALIHLRQAGFCEFSIPELLFDLDFPGHYMRRIKSVAISIPCITGPYTGVNCTLTLAKSSVRHANTLLNGRYDRDAIASVDPRFTDYLGAQQSIVTSHAQNDTGLFETNLHDERYLPFEGCGAISTWTLKLPGKFTADEPSRHIGRQFDYDSISDVVLHIRYTSRDDLENLKEKIENEIIEILGNLENAPLARLFSLRHEFPTEWHQFKTITDNEGYHNLDFQVSTARFPFFLQGMTITLNELDVYGVPTEGVKASEITLPNLELPDLQNSAEVEIWNLKRKTWEGVNIEIEDENAGWRLTLAHEHVACLHDILIVCKYRVGNA
jgi:hypothetical protein